MVLDNRKSAILLLVLAGLSTQTAFADPMPDATSLELAWELVFDTALPAFIRNLELPRPNHWLATVTVGPDLLRRGNANTVELLPPFENYYTNLSRSDTVVDWGVFLGAEKVFSDKLQVQLGVSGYQNGVTSPAGDVWLFGLPQFDVLSYSYEIDHTRVMVEGKFLTTLGLNQTWHPYVSWGVGEAFNRASHYQETPIVDCALPSSAFADHKDNSFTWAVGIGVDYAIMPQVRVGFGYQFADLGSVSLGPTPLANTTQTLSFSNMYANQFRFQISFL